MGSFSDSLVPHEPIAMSNRYAGCGFHASGDSPGFRQLIDIPWPIGKEVLFSGADGNWYFIGHSSLPVSSAATTLHSGWAWPLLCATGTVPREGGRIVIAGGLQRFRLINPTDDGFTIDAIWRADPTAIWKEALQTAVCARSATRQPARPDSIPSSCHTHTAVRSIQKVQRASVALRGRRYARFLRGFNRLAWLHVARPCRARSADHGPGGSIGRTAYIQALPTRGHPADHFVRTSLTRISLETSHAYDLFPIVFVSMRCAQFSSRQAGDTCHFASIISERGMLVGHLHYGCSIALFPFSLRIDPPDHQDRTRLRTLVGTYLVNQIGPGPVAPSALLYLMRFSQSWFPHSQFLLF